MLYELVRGNERLNEGPTDDKNSNSDDQSHMSSSSDKSDGESVSEDISIAALQDCIRTLMDHCPSLDEVVCTHSFDLTCCILKRGPDPRTGSIHDEFCFWLSPEQNELRLPSIQQYSACSEDVESYEIIYLE